MSDIRSYKEHWKKTDDLAGGGQGTTIKAISVQDEKEIAVVKILNRQNDSERRARMHRETIALSTLDHPKLPKIIDFNTEFWQNLEYRLFIATEFIPGSTLSDFDLASLDLSEKILLLIKLCDVIDYCHQRGIIHRDIKPDNIILRNNNFADPVILDFGISFNFNDQDDDTLTADGQHLGNRFLILPEQKIGEVSKRDFRTDVTCLVGVFYYILTNEFPTVLEDENEQKPHQRTKAKQISENYPRHIQDVINNIFDIGFSQLINKRWQTVKSLTDQLNLIEKVEAPTFESAENLINFIKSENTRQTYQEQKSISKLIAEAQEITRNTFNETYKELGEDWVGSFAAGGTSKYSTEGYGNKHAIVNRITKVGIYTYIKVFITGSEIVVHSLVEGKNGVLSSMEVFRQNIQADKNWDVLRSTLRHQYLDAITKEIQNSR